MNQNIAVIPIIDNNGNNSAQNLQIARFLVAGIGITPTHTAQPIKKIIAFNDTVTNFFK